MGLLDGKTILVTGVANRWSIASGIAHRLHAHGAKLVLTYQGDRVEDAVRQHAAELGGAAVFPCDVTSDASLAELAARVGRIDGLVHSIAFVKKEDLSGQVYDTSRDGFAMALDISAYSLIALVGHLKDNLNDGASVMALTYLGATQVVPNYNIAGIAKAALEASVRYLAFDLGARGIRVNAISAGPIKTASSRQVAGFARCRSRSRRPRRCGAGSRPRTSATSPSTWLRPVLAGHGRRALRRRRLPRHGHVSRHGEGLMRAPSDASPLRVPSAEELAAIAAAYAVVTRAEAPPGPAERPRWRVAGRLRALAGAAAPDARFAARTTSLWNAAGRLDG